MREPEADFGPSFAVIFKTYQWDGFIERQLHRLASVSEGGDLWVSVDDTSGAVGAIPHERVDRTNNAELIASGLANRFEKGSLIWWNADYPQHVFFDRHPEYDYYLFVEYDAVVQRPARDLVREAASRGADLVSVPIRDDMGDWYWGLYHRPVYSEAEIQGSLNVISIFSRRAMRLLSERRRDMSRDASVRYWPICEAFIRTEIARAGYVFASLDDFGDTRRCLWFPPMLEADIGKFEGAFLHPVLDERRYAASLLKNGPRLRDYFDRTSPLRQWLARVPEHYYKTSLARAAWRRFVDNQNTRLERNLLRIRYLGMS